MPSVSLPLAQGLKQGFPPGLGPPSCPAPIGMKATAPPRHGPPALTQRPGPFLTRLSPPAFSLLPPLEALRPAPTLRSHPKDGGHRCPHFHLTLPASLLLLCRPHSVGGHSSLRSGRGLAPRLPRPSTVNLGPGPTEGSRGTPSSAPPSLPPLPRDPCSPAGRRSPALDLALGLGYVLPCLLQVHGWKVTCDVFFPVTEAAPEVWAVAAGGGASDMGSRVP